MMKIEGTYPGSLLLHSFNDIHPVFSILVGVPEDGYDIDPNSGSDAYFHGITFVVCSIKDWFSEHNHFLYLISAQYVGWCTMSRRNVSIEMIKV